MQPVSFNTNPLTRNMLDGHVAQAQAMEAMAGQMQGLGQAAQVSSSLGQVSPVGPSAAPASPGQVQSVDGGVFDNVLGKFVHEVNDKHATMGNTLPHQTATRCARVLAPPPLRMDGFCWPTHVRGLKQPKLGRVITFSRFRFIKLDLNMTF